MATNAASGLRLETVAHTNGQATVTFTAMANLTYSVEAASQVSGGTWEKVADIIARSTERVETVTDTRAGEGGRFYRVVTPRRPSANAHPIVEHLSSPRVQGQRVPAANPCVRRDSCFWGGRIVAKWLS